MNSNSITTNKSLLSFAALFIVVLFAVIYSLFTGAKDRGVTTIELASGLGHPWGMDFLPSGELLITERNGQLRLFSNGQLSAPLAGVPRVAVRGQGGLLDVAVDPNFQKQPWVYLSYSASGPKGSGTEVVRAKLVTLPTGEKALTDSQVIFKVSPKTSGDNHFGSRLAFDDQQRLYISLGDKYTFLQEAQNNANHLGAIIRINTDGSVPDSNPFVSKATLKPEIFSHGHRNVQGLAFNKTDGNIWAHEHGPKGGDELNILKSGANYGWPAVTYGIDYSGAIISDKTTAPGITPPVTYWVPSIAPSGMVFYEGEAFPQWQGNILMGSLKFTHLRRLVLEGQTVTSQHTLLESRGARVRDVAVDKQGLIYVLTDHNKGQLLRLSPAK